MGGYLMIDKDVLKGFLSEARSEFTKTEAFQWLMLQLDSCSSPGHYYTGLGALRKVWGWTDNKVRRFLQKLEKLEQIELYTSKKGTIVKWGKKAPQSDRPRTDRSSIKSYPLQAPKTDPGQLLDTKIQDLDSSISSDLSSNLIDHRVIEYISPPVVIVPKQTTSEPTKTPHASKTSYSAPRASRPGTLAVGPYRNVYLSLEEGRALIARFGRQSVISKITSLDCNIENGIRKYVQYKNHAACIRNWCMSDLTPKRVIHEHLSFQASKFLREEDFLRNGGIDNEQKGNGSGAYVAGDFLQLFGVDESKEH